MKKLFTGVFLLFLFLGYGQKDALHLQTDSLSVLMASNVIKNSFQVSDSLQKDWIGEYWSTTKFNPYRNEVHTEFPLRITFTDSTFVFPIKERRIVTSHYGWRNGRPHKGIDLDLVTGDEVMAMFDGVVRYVRTYSGYGKTVVIRHYNGLETVYAHLSKQLVKANDTIVRGQVIGLGGTSGNATGSHLHLEVTFQGIPIHPEYLFDFSTEENNIRNSEIWVTRKWITAHKHSSKRTPKITLYTTEEEAIASNEKDLKVYTVKRGDTLYKIANTHRVTIASLCRTNSIKRNSTLKIGQKLVLKH